MAEIVRQPHYDQFTPTQRRRSEALVLARLLFPHEVLGAVHCLARWIVQGDSRG